MHFSLHCLLTIQEKRVPKGITATIHHYPVILHIPFVVIIIKESFPLGTGGTTCPKLEKQPVVVKLSRVAHQFIKGSGYYFDF